MSGPKDCDIQTKHTLGPWEVRRATRPTDGEFDYAICAMIDGKRVCIAEVFGRAAIDIRPPAEVNARLIAAAPDLLEACHALVAQLEDAMAGVIDHSTGRVFFPGKSDLQLKPDGSYLLSQARAAIAKATGSAA